MLTAALAVVGAAVLIAGCGGHTANEPSSKPADTAGDPDASPTKPAGTPARADASAPSASAPPEGLVNEVICKFNSDCSVGLLCAAGVCHVQCAEARDCPPNQRCVILNEGHVCQLPAEDGCSHNSDCAVPLVCAQDRACRNMCISDRDCVVGEVCAKSEVCANPDELDATGDVPAR